MNPLQELLHGAQRFAPKNNRKRTRGRKYKFIVLPNGKSVKVWNMNPD